MLYQFDVSGFEWMLALGIMFGLAIVMTVLTFNNISTFFIWLTIFCAFVVWGGLLDLWVLILCVIVSTVIIYFEINSNKKGE